MNELQSPLEHHKVVVNYDLLGDSFGVMLAMMLVPMHKPKRLMHLVMVSCPPSIELRLSLDQLGQAREIDIHVILTGKGDICRYTRLRCHQMVRCPRASVVEELPTMRDPSNNLTVPR
ncbi:hypothetical protein NEOLEDRAFT_1138241 [Neolentinus lepideus HHB14362 ss-1]|uniref:Uncharacterized protein n=1 Tax=Neolentinus lepideus HHB14362 ss-1 TaxID=1314782 RepID=A0A165QEB6_9AGAM|nr:hypothetical protein NEOLEDRAFT_1138241 [Neolentinus lepideus HHB14362 ss-1]